MLESSFKLCSVLQPKDLLARHSVYDGDFKRYFIRKILDILKLKEVTVDEAIQILDDDVRNVYIDPVTLSNNLTISKGDYIGTFTTLISIFNFIPIKLIINKADNDVLYYFPDEIKHIEYMTHYNMVTSSYCKVDHINNKEMYNNLIRPNYDITCLNNECYMLKTNMYGLHMIGLKYEDIEKLEIDNDTFKLLVVLAPENFGTLLKSRISDSLILSSPSMVNPIGWVSIDLVNTILEANLNDYKKAHIRNFIYRIQDIYEKNKYLTPNMLPMISKVIIDTFHREWAYNELEEFVEAFNFSSVDDILDVKFRYFVMMISRDTVIDDNITSHPYLTDIKSLLTCLKNEISK